MKITLKRFLFFIVSLFLLAICGCTDAGVSAGPATAAPMRMEAAVHPELHAAAERYLNSTTDITKTLITPTAYERLGGLVLVYSPALDISLKQPWMRAPMPMAVRELRVLGSDPALRSWVLKADGSIMELQGGRPELLSFGIKSLL